MTTIYLIRHAEAEGNLYRIAQGQYNSLLIEIAKYDGEALVEDCDRGPFLAAGIDAEGTPAYVAEGMYEGKEA